MSKYTPKFKVGDILVSKNSRSKNPKTYMIVKYVDKPPIEIDKTDCDYCGEMLIVWYYDRREYDGTKNYYSNVIEYYYKKFTPISK